METDIIHKASLRPLALVGQWPLEISGHKNLRLAHKIYCYILTTYFVLFVITEYVDIFDAIHAGFFDLVNNFTVSLLYTITLLKRMTIHSKAMGKLITQTRDTEQIILNSDDEEIKSIYMKYARLSFKICLGFCIAAWITALWFFTNPVIIVFTDPAMISGEKPRPLSLNAWLPFDKQKHYWWGFGLHGIAATVGSITTGGTSSVFWAMTIFGVAQLKILQYKLKNLNLHAQGFADRGVMDKDAALIHCMKKCILLHKIIIKYVTDLDNLIKNLMFTDFLVCSLQISTVAFQVIVIGDTLDKFLKIEYLVVVLAQLFFFYYNANDIIVESLDLSKSIWEGDIYEYPQTMQKDLAFVMLRAQEPLALNVGPFYAMSTSTLLSILRAIYSYITLLNQFYNN